MVLDNALAARGSAGYVRTGVACSRETVSQVAKVGWT